MFYSAMRENQQHKKYIGGISVHETSRLISEEKGRSRGQETFGSGPTICEILVHLSTAVVPNPL
jgi:hypothetical protein